MELSKTRAKYPRIIVEVFHDHPTNITLEHTEGIEEIIKKINDLVCVFDTEKGKLKCRTQYVRDYENPVEVDYLRVFQQDVTIRGKDKKVRVYINPNSGCLLDKHGGETRIRCFNWEHMGAKGLLPLREQKELENIRFKKVGERKQGEFTYIIYEPE